MSRSGGQPEWSGPRLPYARRQSAYGPRGDEDFGPGPDICNGCGDRYGVMDFGLVRGGKVVGVWRLCPACFEWGSPRDPRDADPRQAA